LDGLNFLEISFIDVTDIILVAVLLYYLYKLVKGTVAINIFLGIVIIYLIWVLTDALNMDVLSNILGKFISVGFFALIVVFQQEIRKFLLLLGSTNYTSRKSLVRYFNFLGQENEVTKLDLSILTSACEKMASEKTGAIIVLERSNSLDFLKNTGDKTQIELSSQILETIFLKTVRFTMAQSSLRIIPSLLHVLFYQYRIRQTFQKSMGCVTKLEPEFLKKLMLWLL
jgi:DNA integrity scanning protein DisA with diadenylate cyclase activity